jgi:hypothetical protein
MTALEDLVWMLIDDTNNEEDIQAVAQAIEETSGYPQAALQLRCEQSVVVERSKDSKRVLLLTLQPYLLAMTQSKDVENIFITSTTGLKCQRDIALDKFNYTDADGEVVEPEFFEKEYV